ncbi:MAG: response regulator [Isosphaeraceae bacterium]|nr:response regulator [Isosphaeraceae bacterium]
MSSVVVLEPVASSSSSPAPSAGPTPGTNQLGTEHPQRPLHLLVVEDEPATSRALSAICRRLGWEVSVAGTLAETWLLLGRKPDVVVLDRILPDGDGIGVLKKVRGENHPVRVAVTTGTVDMERYQAVRDLGPDLFLTKPINLQALLECLGFDG